MIPQPWVLPIEIPLAFLLSRGVGKLGIGGDLYSSLSTVAAWRVDLRVGHVAEVDE